MVTIRTLGSSPVATSVGLSQPVQYHGVLVKSIVAGDCSFLNDGSGVAQLGPKVSFVVKRDIIIRTFVNVAGMEEDEALNWVKSVTEVKDLVQRKEYVLVVDGSERCKHTHPSEVVVKKDEITYTYNKKSDNVRIEIPAVETHVSRCAKLVKNCVKALARPNPALRVFENDVLRTDWELVLPPEAIKGLWEVYFEMACHWKQVSFIRNPGDPQTAEAKALVTEFLVANTKEMEFLYAMEPTEFQRCYSENKDDARYTFHDDGTVHWKGDVVEGYVVLAMENTPVYLSMGKSLLTPEMLLTQSLVCPELAEYRLNNKAYLLKARRLQEFLRAINAKTAPAGTPKLNVEVEINLNLMISDRELFSRLKKLYPNGVILVQGASELYLDLTACAAIGPMDADGNGYSFVKEICQLFRFLAQRAIYTGDPIRRVEQFFNLCAKHLTSAVADAPKFIANVLRPTKVQVTKVTTCSGSHIGLWKMHVSSSDPRVVDGKWKAGDLVINSRCPVYFGATYDVVIDDSVPVGLVMVNPLCWHANTKGDADGDTCFTEVVPEELREVVSKAYANAGYLGKDAYFRLAGLEPQV